MAIISEVLTGNDINNNVFRKPVENIYLLVSTKDLVNTPHFLYDSAVL